MMDLDLFGNDHFLQPVDQRARAKVSVATIVTIEWDCTKFKLDLFLSLLVGQEGKQSVKETLNFEKSRILRSPELILHTAVRWH